MSTTTECVCIRAKLKYSCLDSSSIQEWLCTEGHNLAHAIRHKEMGVDEEAVAFSQYPRPADSPQV